VGFEKGCDFHGGLPQGSGRKLGREGLTLKEVVGGLLGPVTVRALRG